MVKELLKDRKDLFKALKSNKLTPDQEAEILDIFINDSPEFREMMISEMSSDPQFAWLANLSEEEQKQEMKILMKSMKDPAALMESKGFRDQMIEMLAQQNPEMAKIKDLSEEKQKQIVTILYQIGSAASPAQSEALMMQLMADPELAAIFMPADAAGAAHLTQKHALRRSNSLKHTLKVPHFA